MAKKRRDREDDDEERSLVVCKLEERFDVDKLEHIAKLEDINRENETTIQSMLTYKKNHTALIVEYKHSVDFKEGRVCGKGLGALNGRIRRFICVDYHHKIYMSNCGPTLALQIFTKHFGAQCFTMLTDYVHNHQVFIMELQNKYRAELGHFSCSDMKKLVLKGIHWGSYPDNAIMKYIPELKKWTETFRDLTLKLKEIEPYSAFYSDDDSMIGKFTSRVWQYHERQCLFAIKDWFEIYGKKNNIVPVVLFHHGLHVTRSLEGSTTPLPVDMLRACEAFVLANTTMSIELVERPLQPTKEDIAWFWGPFSLSKLDHGDAHSKYLLCRAGQVGNLRRMHGWVLKPHPNVPGALQRDVEAEAFINQVLSKDYETLDTFKMDTLVTWFNKNQHPRFPLMEVDQFDRYIFHIGLDI